MTTLDILKKTRAAWPSIRNRDAEGKNALLRAMADSLMACAPGHSGGEPPGHGGGTGDHQRCDAGSAVSG